MFLYYKTTKYFWIISKLWILILGELFFTEFLLLINYKLFPGTNLIYKDILCHNTYSHIYKVENNFIRTIIFKCVLLILEKNNTFLHTKNRILLYQKLRNVEREVGSMTSSGTLRMIEVECFFVLFPFYLLYFLLVLQCWSLCEVKI